MVDESSQHSEITPGSLAVRLLETEFPGPPIEQFGLCYTGIVNRQTALKSFGQDLMAAAVAGFPGMILFGGKPDYYADFVIIGLQKKKLVLCTLGYIPVTGTNSDDIVVNQQDSFEAIQLALEEPGKIDCRSAALADLTFARSDVALTGSLEMGLSIKGAIDIDLTFIGCSDDKSLSSAKEALLQFQGLSHFPKPKELLLQLLDGRFSFPSREMKEAFSKSGYISTLKDDFSDLDKGQRAAILNQFQDFPEPMKTFFLNWFKEYHNRAPKLIIISAGTTLLTIACLIHIANSLVYHANEPSGFFSMISFIIAIPGIIFSGVLWFATHFNVQYARWYKKLAK